MPEAKIQIKVGAIEFSGEGDEKWVATQLDKILTKATDLLKLAPVEHYEGAIGNGESSFKTVAQNVPLATFLRSKNVGKNQVKTFLATAIWLSNKGKKMLTTREVTTAIVDNHQKGLNNPSDCLNQNVKKGYCEKSGKEFYITPDGFESMK